MARFAHACREQMNRLVIKLELVLGPGTASLGIRIGLHSGPTTAGILRGDKARFQLFGDTVNTGKRLDSWCGLGLASLASPSDPFFYPTAIAARLESTGDTNRIHISQATADELAKAGKGHWYAPRDGVVFAKGKGRLQTYFLQAAQSGSTFGGGEALRMSGFETCSTVDSEQSPLDSPEIGDEELKLLKLEKERTQTAERLVDWNVSLLENLLQQVMASRAEATQASERKLRTVEASIGKDGMVIEEVKSIITLPQFNQWKAAKSDKSVKVPKVVKKQLKEYVTLMMNSYLQNPFHNFEHASHVAMSVNKLLSRIVAPDTVDFSGEPSKKCQRDAAELHDHTYGITSDPLTQLGIVLSALCHDIDHRGVPNGQLCLEDEHLASVYQGKSVAEQNSVDLGWAMLMDDKFRDLRGCMYSNEDELMRLRQIIVNSVVRALF